MRMGLDINQQRMPFHEVVARARLAEDAGFDGVWGFDHFQPTYGDGPGECFEGMTTLAALTGRVSRVRLGLLVAGVTYRHPAVFAAEALTVDHASDGRLELSLGAAWLEEEHRSLGIEFPPTAERIDRLDEALSIIRGLLSENSFSFDGRFWQVADASLVPRPVQQPCPPIWVGASGEQRMIPLAARHADVWHTFGDVATIARRSKILDRAAEAAGRDPGSITRAAMLGLSEPWDEVLATAHALRSVGVSYLVCGWPTEGQGRVEEFVNRILPELIDL